MKNFTLLGVVCFILISFSSFTPPLKPRPVEFKSNLVCGPNMSAFNNAASPCVLVSVKLVNVSVSPGQAFVYTKNYSSGQNGSILSYWPTGTSTTTSFILKVTISGVFNTLTFQEYPTGLTTVVNYSSSNTTGEYLLSDGFRLLCGLYKITVA